MTVENDDEIVIVTPPIADQTDALEFGLVSLTEAISQLDSERIAHGFLGGEFGYGADFENDVFMMHHYCWCELEDCLWCGGCGCDRGDCRHFIDGQEVSSDESWKRNEAFLGPMPHDKFEHDTPEYEAYASEWEARVAERDRRWTTLYPAVIHTCARRDLMANRNEGDDWRPRQTAPHFIHKRTGLRVWWYKWIGRDMEIEAPEGIDYAAVFGECAASLAGNKREDV